jgi:hypothetical protein
MKRSTEEQLTSKNCDNGPLNTKTQRAEILALLVKARGEWVPLPEIMACAAQYNARLFELRRLGFKIENRTETVKGQRHSFFRLWPSTKPDPVAEANSDFVRRRREEEARENPLFARGVAA